MNVEVAAASVVGTSHLRAGRNGQDAFAVLRCDDTLVAVVADGCGSAPHSEVGAKLGARIAARALLRHHASPRDAAATIVRRLRAVAATIDADVERVMHDYFLFTLVALVMTPQRTTILAAGDGLFLLDGELHRLGPFAGNAPPYLGYGDTRLTLAAERATSTVSHVVLGTDGCDRLPIDPAALAHEDVVFRNPDALRRRLFRYTRAPQAVLDDDTTMVVVRRVA